MENNFNLLKDREEELNNISRQKGFELKVIHKYKNFGEIHIKRLDNKFPTNSIIYIRTHDSDYIGILDKNNRWIYDMNINDIHKWVYNYLNYNEIQFVCNFIGGKYDGQTMNKEEIEKISLKPINAIIPKVTENEYSPFEDMFRYIPFIHKYYYSTRPSIDYGIIYYTFISSIQ